MEPITGCVITSVEAVVEVGATLCEHAAGVHREVLAQPRVTLDALAVLAGEVVTGDVVWILSHLLANLQCPYWLN